MKTKNMIYYAPAWLAFREQVLAADEYRCTKCSKPYSQRTLQVHHKYYITGRLPWEYPLQACQVLCKSCHAQHHGKAQPMKGWRYMGYAQVRKGRLPCENCQTRIRHCYYIFNPKWGTLQVGTQCCDQLTGHVYAADQQRKEAKRKRYLKSEKWRLTSKGNLLRRYKGRHILVFQRGGYFALRIENTFGKKQFASALAAQNHAFEIIHHGQLQRYEEALQ